MPTYQFLTDRSLAQSTAITPTTLIHIVTTGDTSQNAAGSSYKAQLQQLIPIFSGSAGTSGVNGSSGTSGINGSSGTSGSSGVSGTSGIDGSSGTSGVSGTSGTSGINGSSGTSGLSFSGGSGNCITDLYVSNIHSCSPLNINPLDEGNVYFGSTSAITIDLTNNRVGIGTTTPTSRLSVSTTGSTTGTTPAFRFLDGVSTPTDTSTIKSFYKEFRPTTKTTSIVVGDGTFLYPNITSTSSADFYAKANLTLYTDNLSLLTSGEALKAETNVIQIQSTGGTYNGYTIGTTSILRNVTSGGTIDKYIGFWMNGFDVNYTHNGTTNNIYGFYMDSQSGRSGNIPATTNRYGVYIEDVGRNYFAGTVGIGTTTPAEKLEVNGKTKTTNFQMTSGATDGYVLTSDSNGNGTWQSSSGFTNIYNSDGTLTGNRNVNFTGSRLQFSGTVEETIGLTLRASSGAGNRFAKLSAVNGSLQNNIDVSIAGTSINSSDTGYTNSVSTDSVGVNITASDYTGYTNTIDLDSFGILINSQYYLPPTDGITGQVLTTNGSGTTSWQNNYGYQYYSAVTITSAQTLSIGSIPVQVLPAPGVNKYYDFKVFFEYVFNTVAYSSTGTFQLVDNTTKRVTNQFDISGQLTNRVFVSDMNFQNQFTSLNSQIEFTTSNGSNPTLGDGSFKVKIYYNIIDFG